MMLLPRRGNGIYAMLAGGGLEDENEAVEVQSARPGLEQCRCQDEGNLEAAEVGMGPSVCTASSLLC